MRRVRVVVSGGVQGVWFRVSCAERAQALGLAGWVRNRSDGSVEAVFEGPSEAVTEMLGWCRSGPPLARVDTLEVTDEAPTGEQNFLVRG